jgi:hypothetical protein
MGLIDLPEKVLKHIIDYTFPCSFESFVLTCKRVYAVGEEHITTHHERKRTYKDFQYNAEIRCALQLLHRIADDPLIAEYVEEADLHPVDEDYHWGDAEQHKVDDQDAIEDITRFVKASDFYRSLPAIQSISQKTSRKTINLL